MDFAPFDHAAAWTPQDLGGIPKLEVSLSRKHRDGLLAALDQVRDLAPEAITREVFPLTSMAADVARWSHDVKQGRGLLFLRGMPIEGLDTEDAARMFFGLGTHFGVAVSQSNNGEKLGHVVNVGGQDPRERAYRSARRLGMHTDRCDYVGMLCVRPAAHGGISGYSSALAVHNEILKTRPELLAPLYRGFRLHRFGEQTDDSPLTSEPVPVFTETDGVPNIVYIRGYINLAVNEGHYALSDIEQEALDYFDEVADREDMKLEVRLESGDATFTNNCVLLHNRTAFEDHDDPAKARHLMRLWLMDPDLPAAASIRAHKNMYGIEKVEGRGTYYTATGGVT